MQTLARRLGSRASPEHAVCGDDTWRRPLGGSPPTGAFQWEGLVGEGAGTKYAYRQEADEGLRCNAGRARGWGGRGGGKGGGAVSFVTDRRDPPWQRFAAAPSHRVGPTGWGGGGGSKLCMGGRVGLGGRRPDPAAAARQEAEANY